jgi:putative SOS response-associated peptidase YedK
MCGRFILTEPADALRQLFLFDERPNLGPRYNIAPTQEVPVVVAEEGVRHLRPMRWGLVPFWAKERAIGNRLINARSETAATTPAFRSAYRHRRCLVPANGFYEWQKLGKARQPWLIGREDGGAFAMAGLWERWDGVGEALFSFTILTTAANDPVRPLHDRMPVILDPADHATWLDPSDPGGAALLRPYPGGDLEAQPVSTRVNSPRHDDPSCIAPVTLPAEA